MAVVNPPGGHPPSENVAFLMIFRGSKSHPRDKEIQSKSRGGYVNKWSEAGNLLKAIFTNILMSFSPRYKQNILFKTCHFKSLPLCLWLYTVSVMNQAALPYLKLWWIAGELHNFCATHRHPARNIPKSRAARFQDYIWRTSKIQIGLVRRAEPGACGATFLAELLSHPRGPPVEQPVK